MKTFFRFICIALERCCCLTHPFVEIEILLTGRYCNLTSLSFYIDEKFNVGSWKTVPRDFYCPECGAIYHNKWFVGKGCRVCGLGVVK